MLLSDILNSKKQIDFNGIKGTDLIQSTFKFPENSTTSLVAVGMDENMRPDLVVNRVFGNQMMWDILLKFNGISNPFTLKQGDILYAIPFKEAMSSIKPPITIINRDSGKEEQPISPLLDPKTKKDKDRLKNLQDKIGEVVPPNVNRSGDKNVKVKDGKVIFGDDVTTIKKENCPVPISRNRLQAALLKDKIFI